MAAPGIPAADLADLQEERERLANSRVETFCRAAERTTAFLHWDLILAARRRHRFHEIVLANLH